MTGQAGQAGQAGRMTSGGDQKLQAQHWRRGALMAQVVALADGTRTASEIARALTAASPAGGRPVTTRSVANVARRRGLPLLPQAQRHGALAAQVQAGAPVAQVAAAAGVTASAVYAQLARRGVRLQRNGPSPRVTLTLPPDVHAWLAEDCPEGRALAAHVVSCLRGVMRDQERSAR